MLVRHCEVLHQLAVVPLRDLQHQQLRRHQLAVGPLRDLQHQQLRRHRGIHHRQHNRRQCHRRRRHVTVRSRLRTLIVVEANCRRSRHCPSVSSVVFHRALKTWPQIFTTLDCWHPPDCTMDSLICVFLAHYLVSGTPAHLSLHQLVSLTFISSIIHSSFRFNTHLFFK